MKISRNDGYKIISAYFYFIIELLVLKDDFLKIGSKNLPVIFFVTSSFFPCITNFTHVA